MRTSNSCEAEYFKSLAGKYQKALEADGLITIKSKDKIYNPANKAEWFNALDIALPASASLRHRHAENRTGAIQQRRADRLRKRGVLS